LTRGDQENKRLLYRGAEADLFRENWHGLDVVRKVRGVKRYRAKRLDEELRRTRTAREVLIMHDARKAGVSTPLIYLVDMEATTILMQYVEGTRLKEYLEASETSDRLLMCKILGDIVARLHSAGIVHGDLTTSNVIVTSRSRLVLIDFGLAEYSRELESRGVDLVLGQRVFHSTHQGYGAACYQALLEGYRERVGNVEADEVEERVKEIGRRGRYAIER
jgi:TP53 regulating kinase-like protein